MKIAICGDHRGYRLKEDLKEKIISKLGYECLDFGTFSEEMCDFPPLAFKVGECVSKGEADYGVVICGSGDGVCIASNKVKGIRCTITLNSSDAYRAKAHVNANVIALGSEKTDLLEAIKIVKTLVETEFLECRYKKRIEMISDYENGHE